MPQECQSAVYSGTFDRVQWVVDGQCTPGLHFGPIWTLGPIGAWTCDQQLIHTRNGPVVAWWQHPTKGRKKNRKQRRKNISTQATIFSTPDLIFFAKPNFTVTCHWFCFHFKFYTGKSEEKTPERIYYPCGSDRIPSSAARRGQRDNAHSEQSICWGDIFGRILPWNIDLLFFTAHFPSNKGAGSSTFLPEEFCWIFQG